MAVSFSGQDSLDVTAPAGADLSGSLYCFVVLNASGAAVLPGSTGAVADGILQNQPTAGRPAQIRVFGGSKLVAAGAVAVGVDIATNAATGRGLAAVSTNRRLARSYTGCSNAGETISVFLRPDGNMP